MEKGLFLFILGLLLISTASLAQIRIVELPEYESSNTNLLDINKLELTDSVTILYCDVYNRPNAWIRLSSNSYLKGKSGQIYNLVRSEGFELDKKVNMPVSGSVSFKLYMGPLDKNENSFDFMEGENEGDFRITGIKTYKVKPIVTSIQCVLKGDVIDRPHSSRLVLTKERGDERVSAKYIPIRTRVENHT